MLLGHFNTNENYRNLVKEKNIDWEKCKNTKDNEEFDKYFAAPDSGLSLEDFYARCSSHKRLSDI